MENQRRNRNRGYQQLRVWGDAIELYALGSAGESVSGVEAFREAGQISGSEFEQLDEIAFRLENRLLKLVEQLERRRNTGDWTDTLVVEESTADYGDGDDCDKDVGLFVDNAVAD